MAFGVDVAVGSVASFDTTTTAAVAAAAVSLLEKEKKRGKKIA